MKTPPTPKLAFRQNKGVTFVSPDDIVHCEADSNYTTIHFQDKSRLIVCKKLKEVESALPPGDFLRVHNSFLVRSACVTRYLHEGSQLLLSSGQVVPVARRRKKEMMGRFKAV